MIDPIIFIIIQPLYVLLQNYNGTVRCYANNDPDFAGLCNPQFVQDPMGGSTNMAEPPLTGNTQISPSEVQVNVRPGKMRSVGQQVYTP